MVTQMPSVSASGGASSLLMPHMEPQQFQQAAMMGAFRSPLTLPIPGCFPQRGGPPTISSSSQQQQLFPPSSGTPHPALLAAIMAASGGLTAPFGRPPLIGGQYSHALPGIPPGHTGFLTAGPHFSEAAIHFQEQFNAGLPAGMVELNALARRKNATRETTSALKAWLNEHKKNPYPTKGEKIMLAIITKMTLTQVSTWFANARRRLKKENKVTWSVNSGPGEGGDHNNNEDSDDDDELEGEDDDLEENNRDVKHMASELNESGIHNDSDDDIDVESQERLVLDGHETKTVKENDEAEKIQIRQETKCENSIPPPSGFLVFQQTPACENVQPHLSLLSMLGGGGGSSGFPFLAQDASAAMGKFWSPYTLVSPTQQKQLLETGHTASSPSKCCPEGKNGRSTDSSKSRVELVSPVEMSRTSSKLTLEGSYLRNKFTGAMRKPLKNKIWSLADIATSDAKKVEDTSLVPSSLAPVSPLTEASTLPQPAVTPNYLFSAPLLWQSPNIQNCLRTSSSVDSLHSPAFDSNLNLPLSTTPQVSSPAGTQPFHVRDSLSHFQATLFPPRSMHISNTLTPTRTPLLMLPTNSKAAKQTSLLMPVGGINSQ